MSHHLVDCEKKSDRERLHGDLAYLGQARAWIPPGGPSIRPQVEQRQDRPALKVVDLIFEAKISQVRTYQLNAVTRKDNHRMKHFIIDRAVTEVH